MEISSDLLGKVADDRQPETAEASGFRREERVAGAPECFAVHPYAVVDNSKFYDLREGGMARRSHCERDRTSFWQGFARVREQLDDCVAKTVTRGMVEGTSMSRTISSPSVISTSNAISARKPDISSPSASVFGEIKCVEFAFISVALLGFWLPERHCASISAALSDRLETFVRRGSAANK